MDRAMNRWRKYSVLPAHGNLQCLFRVQASNRTPRLEAARRAVPATRYIRVRLAE
jgi:hypothetical protein